MAGMPDTAALVERYCARGDLRTADPYDVWKTGLGFRVKDFYNHHRRLGLLPAALLTLVDAYPNNRLRLGYEPQEYPVVRALAALCCLNLHARDGDGRWLAHARRHLAWLEGNASPGYRGTGWGIGFRQPILPGLVYEAALPLSTMTPYALEAFVRYDAEAGDRRFRPVIEGIHRFFRDDLVVMEEGPDTLATSYGAFRDRIVVNAQSYHLYALAELLAFLPPAEAAAARDRIRRLYGYVTRQQRDDGSWLYAPEGPPFIDCFHSCMVLKNLLRASWRVDLPGVADVIDRGYAYVTTRFRADGEPLFRRFTLENKPSLVRYDLYDNAEVLGLAALRGDLALAEALDREIARAFAVDGVIYSQIDRFGLRHNADMLRWAVLPYVHARTLLDGARAARAG